MRIPSRGLKPGSIYDANAALKHRSATVLREAVLNHRNPTANAERTNWFLAAWLKPRPFKIRFLFRTLAHHRGVLGLHFVDHAHFVGLAVGIFFDSEIFFGHLVDVGAGALFGDLNDAAANF
jgi:hypothetical protein